MNNLFLFWGQEDFLINFEIEKIKTKYVDKNFETMAYKKLYKPCFDDVISSIQSIPMMFGNIMHVIDMNEFLLSGEESSLRDWELNSFENALKNMSDKNIVVLRCIIPSDSKKKVDTRKKIYKIISNYAEVKQFSFFNEYDKTLPKIIMDLGSTHGLKLSSNIVPAIINQIGVNLGIINSELQKVAICIYPKTSPTVDDIENICVSKDNVFSILEAVFIKKYDKALIEFKKVLEKKDIMEILAALQTSLRNYVFIKANFQRLGKYEISTRLRIPAFIIEKTYRLVSGMSGKELLALKRNLLKAEYLIKTGECVSAEVVMEMFLMRGLDV